MRIILRILTYIVATLLVVYIATILIVPAIVDKKFNTSTLLPPYNTTEEAQVLYDNLPFVADLHCDALLWKRDLIKKHDYGHVDIPRMIEAGMALQAFTIVSKTPKNMNFDNNTGETDNITSLFIAEGRAIKTWFSLKQRALDQCQRLFDFAEDSEGDFRIITSTSELARYVEDRDSKKAITAGFLGVEGMHALEGDLDNVKEMFDAGIRMMAPVHFFDNELGGSAHGVSKAGLTDFGKEVIREMQEKKMIVDLSHAAPQLIDDILKISTQPLIVSHTGVKGTCDNVRNLSDEHLKGIAATGGLIGIAIFEQAVCGTDAMATAMAINYTVDLVGVNHVALGSDFDGALTMHFDVTGFPLIVAELLKLGLNAEDISKVMGENTRDFLLRNLPEE